MKKLLKEEVMSKKILVGIIVFILIWITIWLQVNVIKSVPLFGVTANIAIVVSVGIGILCDKIPGALVGAVYGILFDIIFGKSVGVYFLLYTVLGLVSGMLSGKFSKENKMSVVYMSGAFTVVTEIITYLIFMIIYGYQLELLSVFWIIVNEAIYNMIIAIILFKPLTGIAEIINRSKNSYYML